MQPNAEPKENPPRPIQVLLIEDDEVDARWVRRALRGSPAFRLTAAGTLAAGLGCLKAGTFDIILSDLHLPDAGGLEVFEALSRQKPEAPIVLLTGSVLDEEKAMEAIHKGAQDYLIKGQVDERALIRALHYAMERKRLLLMRDHFVHVVSHELRNPLTIMCGSIAMLHRNPSPDEAQNKKTLQMAFRAVQRLLRTTEDLLDLAKMESRKYSFRQERFSLNTLVEEVAEFFQAEIGQKGLAFRKTLPEHDLEVLADRDQIARVVMNLLHNALKFTRKGRIEILVEEEEGLARCAVTDTGPGIAAEDMPRLFQKFSQPGGANIVQGTGLGLSICKEILDAHKGRIWAESARGQGASFLFTVPRAPVPGTGPEAEAPPSA